MRQNEQLMPPTKSRSEEPLEEHLEKGPCHSRRLKLLWQQVMQPRNSTSAPCSRTYRRNGKWRNEQVTPQVKHHTRRPPEEHLEKEPCNRRFA